MHDLYGRGYVSMPIVDVAGRGLPMGFLWYYCVLPLRRHSGVCDVPQLGQAVGYYHVCKLGPGFVRGRAVGVVALR